MEELFNMLFRWGHILVGITWIGLLYYFNFVQTEYFKEAEESARKDAVSKLVPRALWWFRWAALFTFLTGIVLLYIIQAAVSLDIILGATMGTLMMLNVWGIIWPNQKIVIGLKEGDPGIAGPKAALASRTNTLFSIPMLYFMVSSAHTTMFTNKGGFINMTPTGEVTSSLKSHGLLRKSDHLFYSLKTLKGCYLTMKGKPLESSFKRWMNWGTMSNGNCLTASISFHKIGKGSSLSDILEDQVAEKYYLSERSVRGMINHAKNSTQKTNVLQPSQRHTGKDMEEVDQ